MINPPTRVVTGHDGARSTVTSIGVPPKVIEMLSHPGVVFYELWNTAPTPATVDNGPDPTLVPLRIQPPANGTIVRMVDIPPDTPEFLERSAAAMKKTFLEMGEADVSTMAGSSPHPGMHRTETVDYAVVLSGEITLILEDGETTLSAGDIVIQRGTNHSWANRSGEPARMLFVLIDGQFAPDLANQLR